MLRRVGCLIVILLTVGAAWLFGRDYVRRHPQDVPWTRLELGDPIGYFTGRKLAALGNEPIECRAMLRRGDIRDLAAPAVQPNAQCGYDDGMRIATGGERNIAFRPAIVTSCPVAAALALWEIHSVRPAAERYFGSRVTTIDHAGSYSCRRLYGRGEGQYSTHATADAVDIIGFRLADGTRISVLRDWNRNDARAAFLRSVRDGACPLFATVLSPDYNAAHADHFHFDQAERGAAGWRLCR